MRISRPFRDWSCWPMVPSTGSALYLLSNSMQLVCAEPYWANIRSSLRDFALQTAVATPGLDRNAPRTEPCACDPALIQPSGKPGTYVGTLAARLKSGPDTKHKRCDSEKLAHSLHPAIPEWPGPRLAMSLARSGPSFPNRGLPY